MSGTSATPRTADSDLRPGSPAPNTFAHGHAISRYSGPFHSNELHACSIAPNDRCTSCTAWDSSSQKLWLVMLAKRTAAARTVIPTRSHVSASSPSGLVARSDGATAAASVRAGRSMRPECTSGSRRDGGVLRPPEHQPKPTPASGVNLIALDQNADTSHVRPPAAPEWLRCTRGRAHRPARIVRRRFEHAAREAAVAPRWASRPGDDLYARGRARAESGRNARRAAAPRGRHGPRVSALGRYRSSPDVVDEARVRRDRPGRVPGRRLGSVRHDRA